MVAGHCENVEPEVLFAAQESFILYIDWANQISSNVAQDELMDCINNVFLKQDVEAPMREYAILDLLLL